jgi:outer membrane protein assembly factor BamC
MSLFGCRQGRRQGRIVVAAALAAGAVVACGTIETSDKIDYRAAPAPKSLDVPPDLSPLPKEDRFQVPSATVSGTAKGPAAATAPSGVVPPVPVARLQRDGSQRWLAIDLPPEQVIDQVKEMFKAAGLRVERDDAALGIVETGWAENHAKLPLDFLRRTLGRATDAFYSTGELDKYRARIERTEKNTSEVYISHRGMVEVYTSTQREDTRWQLRPSEPELEAELLRRLQLRFLQPSTAPTEVAAAAPAGAPRAPAPPQNARLVKGASPADTKVSIDEPFDRAWRRVGLALDRGGFTVEDRDRTKGVYFVRYLDPDYEAKQRDQQGIFSKMFGRDLKIDAQQFRVVLAANPAAGTDVTVLDKDGRPEASATGAKILAQITEQLR